MKRIFGFYAVIWALLLTLYNFVLFTFFANSCFAPDYDVRFWISWGFIIFAFLGQLICAYIAFRGENKNKLFLNVSIISQSYIGTILSTVVGSSLIFIEGIPAYLASVICVVVFCFNVISVLKAKAASDTVENTDKRIKTQTAFVSAMTVRAENLMAKAKASDVKAELEKLYEAIRYSDPMSVPDVSDTENQISALYTKLEQALETDDIEGIKMLSGQISLLVGERNSKIKLIKV